MYKIAIVGLGPAGIFTLALLPEELLPHIIVFESLAIGGALATDYGSVIANLTKSTILEAFRGIPRWTSDKFALLEKYEDNQCPLLNDVVRQLRELIAPDLLRVSFHNLRVNSYKLCESHESCESRGNFWELSTSNGVFETQKLILCTGATPKTLDLPKYTIPLSVALTPALLPNFISPLDRVLVFGTAHSGTLVLKNLHSAGISKLTAIYKGEKPFYYFRDGFSEGIKQESATIADDLAAKKWATLIRADDFAGTHRAILEATAVIYAIGFEPHNLHYLENNISKPFFVGSSSAPNVYGFGIGYPGFYTGADGIQYPDVGFGGFINKIKAALPSMLTFDS
jgi:cation diffusion facilitator CzcD-associated flavoprotein CzcO